MVKLYHKQILLILAHSEWILSTLGKNLLIKQSTDLVGLVTSWVYSNNLYPCEAIINLNIT